MKITKFGHCCLLIEEQGLRILTDPGSYSTLQNEVKDIDVILITHEHSDHLHIESLKTVLKNNFSARVITNKGVGVILDKESIVYEIVEDEQKLEIRGIKIEGCGKKHAIMYRSLPLVDNTGYFIGDKLFYPGDAFTLPGKPVDILALPVAGPWLTLSDAIDYAKRINPKKCFPVHEGILKSAGTTHRIPPQILEPIGIKFIVIEEGKSFDFE